MTDLSRNAQCILRILDGEDSLTTSQILEKAKQSEFKDICMDCAGGDAFIVAANQLVDKGMIVRKFGKGGYRWQLVGE
ncbi:MAG: hypothetical protein BAJATHORv1_20332 [Candidatus Thorarchaeota archaeon]|nr:MAG: hypothetical protein BAJATHORv1_20332 [Candidatus Thorarchaeota archaeon]